MGINYNLGLEQLSGGGTLGRKTRVQVVSKVAVDHHTELVIIGGWLDIWFWSLEVLKAKEITLHKGEKSA